jgi:hypothetical protein
LYPLLRLLLSSHSHLLSTFLLYSLLRLLAPQHLLLLLSRLLLLELLRP